MSSGFYYRLLEKGKIKEEDKQPDVELFQFYIDAFQELGTCRSNSMSVGPIPFTAIVEYSRIYEVDDFEEFLYFIRLMDNTFLDLESKRAASKGTNVTANTNSKNSN